jgi:twitching motility protein PilT
MQTLNQSLYTLFQKRMITLEDAIGRSSNPEELKQMLVNAGALRASGQN